jgi:integrase
MTPRTASLRVAHQAHCPNSTRSAVDSIDQACRRSGCVPSYFTFHRGHDGKPRKSVRVKDRRVADKMLRAVQVEIDKGRAGYVEARAVSFPDWVKQFRLHAQQRVDNGALKPGTLRAYNETIDSYAIPAIGWVDLRVIGQPHLRDFYESLSALSPASRTRHLRQLSVVLAAAVDEGLMPTNPVPVFRKKLNLKTPKRGKAPFEDGELERLWGAYRAKMNQEAKPWAPVYLYATQFAVETGLRIGELAAVELDSLRGGDLKVLHTFGLDGLVAPKNGKERTVYLTEHALKVLAKWLPIRGDAPGPLFPSPQGGRLSIRETQRKLDKAMTAAGIPREHPDIGLPRSFHSLRYSTSNLMQRRGHHPRFIEQTLGHSTLELTMNVYGGWTPDQMRKEAAHTAQ